MKKYLLLAVMCFSFLFIGLGCDEKRTINHGRKEVRPTPHHVAPVHPGPIHKK